MARGWESKSIESQIDAAQIDAAEVRRRTHALPAKSPEQIGKETERNSIAASRAGVVRDLEGNPHPRRRLQLEAALAFLDDKLRNLE